MNLVMDETVEDAAGNVKHDIGMVVSSNLKPFSRDSNLAGVPC